MIDRIRAHWPLLRRIGIAAFFALVVWLVVDRARQIEWASVLQALRAYPPGVLLAAGGLAAASYAVYCSYDLIGRHVTGHRLGAWHVLRVSFVSYAFNLNFGALVGGFAVRYRLYGRLGLDTGVVTRLLGLGLISNWLGYLALGGTAFLLLPLGLPPYWALGSGGLRLLGAAMLSAALTYLTLCGFARKRRWQVRGHAIELPGGRVALLQLLLSMLNWSLMAAAVWVLLRQRIDPTTVLEVLMIAAVAGVIAHVPAGLGVLEGVFLALLAHRAGHAELLAALLCYRALYYLAPLGLAAPLFFWLDARAKAAGAGAEPRQPPASMSKA